MTTELIKTTGITLNGDKITAVNARDLWKFLESKQEFANWIKDRIRKYGFKEGLDFTVDKIINGENKGRFAATINMILKIIFISIFGLFFLLCAFLRINEQNFDKLFFYATKYLFRKKTYIYERSLP